MTQHSQNGEGVEVSARIKMIGGLIDRLEERRQIRWNAPDKDGVIHQLVDRQYLIDAIICLDAYRQSLAREPATADVGRALEAAARAMCDRVNGAGDYDENSAQRRSGWVPQAKAGIDAYLTTLSRAAPSSEPAIAEGERQDTVAFVQSWLMNADYDPSQFDRDFAAAIDARCATTPPTPNDAIPAGWKLVPVELTPEMAKAGAKGRQNSAISSFRDGWKLALSAAPSAPATEAGAEV